MTVLIAPDKFKGTLTAPQVCAAITEGVLALNASLRIFSIPMADGGEGTSNVLTQFSRGSKVKVRVLDPLFREIDSEYGISQDGKTAFIEMASASGLGLLTTEERNPLCTTTFGTGQLIKDAIEHGAEHIILGIGGSATTDAGMGMAAALGYTFLSEDKAVMVPTGQNLIYLHDIRTHAVHPALAKTEFTVLCDVDNPLCGIKGAANIFGPQKGATQGAVKALDAGLQHFQNIAESTFHVSLNFGGAGAAGGLGAGAKVFLNAKMEKGFDFISKFIKLDSLIQQSDLVITGEGKIDLQTFSGKVVSGVASLAARHQKPCIAFAGQCELSPDLISELHLVEIISLTDSANLAQDSMEHAFTILRDLTKRRLASRIPSI